MRFLTITRKFIAQIINLVLTIIDGIFDLIDAKKKEDEQ